MIKKTAEQKVVKVAKSSEPTRAADNEASAKQSSQSKSEETKSAEPAPSAPPRKRQVLVKAKAPRRSPAATPVIRNAIEQSVEAMRADLRDLKGTVRKLVSPPAVAGRRGSQPNGSDTALEGAVDSLRRLLSELIERRMESVVRDLVEVRREAASLADGGARGIVERLDHVLDHLGAVRFDAEPMDVVDPLIHTVLAERHDQSAPEGVIVETLRPGYRTGRGLVVCKAAVAVNRRS